MKVVVGNIDKLLNEQLGNKYTWLWLMWKGRELHMQYEAQKHSVQDCKTVSGISFVFGMKALTVDMEMSQDEDRIPHSDPIKQDFSTFLSLCNP